MLIVGLLVDLPARGIEDLRSVPSARERASALAGGSRRRPLVHAQFGARPKVAQTRKMGVLPAQKGSGDALRAYLGVIGASVGMAMGTQAPLDPPLIRRHIVPPCGSARRP